MEPFLEQQMAQTRRTFLQRSGFCLGAMALGQLLRQDSHGALESKAGRNPLSARLTRMAPRARNIIYLHMVGAPSQLDLFDPKPELNRRDGELCPKEFIEGKQFAFIRGHPRLMGSQFQFGHHGQSGHPFSELLPHLSQVADELAVVRTMSTDEFNHAPAQMFLQTGFGQPGRPSLGSWLTYGLGTENRNLPAYVVLMTGAMAGAGSTLWAPGFLPSVYQGIQFRSNGDPVLFLSNPKGHSREDRRRQINLIQSLNRERLKRVGDPEIQTRISQYEMAYRMQASVPDLMDISQESRATLDLYGAQPGKVSFANNCLLARRLVERGVRTVQLFDSGWDHHSNLNNGLKNKCRGVDQPMAALILDLKRHGLLDETLIVFASEFGRTPMLQGSDDGGGPKGSGRDHHKEAYTVWLAGGGIRGGVSYGRTDEFGYFPVENPCHVHDLNATVLHLLGIDHEELTFKYQGREFRLTDVHGNVLQDILA